MKHASYNILFFVAALVSCAMSAYGQETHKGWPSRQGEIDIRTHFRQPPKGYGNVPFYWWSGDSLNLERLTEQLEILSDASTDGLCVSYHHTHAEVEVELNAAGHGPCGRVCGGEPRVMSPEWWKLWNQFSARCAQKGIGLGMDDYVIAWPKNGEYTDSIILSEPFRQYQGLLAQKVVPASGTDFPATTLCRVPRADDSLLVVYTVPSPELHPQYGAEIIKHYFQRFEDSMDAEGRKGMNYFFQDELQYNLRLLSWAEDMPQQFMQRKGYDIVPCLPKLFIAHADSLDEEAIRVRLDYAEVLTQLSEERYFKPIFDWHNSRGLIYGCDNEGRGLRPTQYLDYFRAVSWFTAPGNDAPARGSSFRQTKVSSSIAHLYNRPRTWLEAFHSMGWDANGGVLIRQLDHHLIAGGNLLCMHGLYYSTHGSWWEWAPPCFHFHMPYWPHMKNWLKYAERMCFVLSQGVHVADVAVLYPTEAMQAIPGASIDLTFQVTDSLSNTGIDYDYIDYQSLQKAEISQGMLNVADEHYKVLVLADISAMHEATLQKINQFAKAGGTVIAVGKTVAGLQPTRTFAATQADKVAPAIRSSFVTDFQTSSLVGKVLHRRVGNRQVYMVMDVPKGDEMFFRTHGKVEQWDALHGVVTPLEPIRTDSNGTWVRYEGETGNSMLLVVNEGEANANGVKGTPNVQAPSSGSREMALAGPWRIQVIPTMDNTWGDYRLPASPGMIGVEAREVECTPLGVPHPVTLTSACGYGPYMRTVTLDSLQDVKAFMDEPIPSANWKPYVFSWQYGVFDSPGSQGYHGLKSRVDDGFLLLDQAGHQIFQTDMLVPADGEYQLLCVGVKPDLVKIDQSYTDIGNVRLDAGWHTLTLAYANTRRADYSLEGMRCYSVDKRSRSMVVCYPANAARPQPVGMYAPVVASSWHGTSHLVFDNRQVPAYSYTFKSAPGIRQMRIAVHGCINVATVDGRAVRLRDEGVKDQIHYYVLDMPRKASHIAKVNLEAQPEAGYPGAAFFAEPVKLACGPGQLDEGDWTKAGALKYFSGGIRYAKVVRLDAKPSQAVLDLGEIDATCEVTINGHRVDVLLSAPYKLDVSQYVRKGKNVVEVLVYSSLSNHYVTIPSPYKGTPRAGLIGPVRLVLQ